MRNTGRVIVRTWSARASEAGAADYQSYFEHTLLPELREIAGFRGVLLLTRPDGDLIEITAHTMWESLAAIEAFAGDDIALAKVEPEARAMLAEIGSTVTHRTTVLAELPVSG
jgi:heme-degrading monooxygenase HmoA